MLGSGAPEAVYSVKRWPRQDGTLPLPCLVAVMCLGPPLVLLYHGITGPPRFAARKLKKCARYCGQKSASSKFAQRWNRLLPILLRDDRDEILNEAFDRLLDETSGAQAKLVAKVHKEAKRTLANGGHLENLAYWHMDEIRQAVSNLQVVFRATAAWTGESFDSYTKRHTLRRGQDWYTPLIEGFSKELYSHEDVATIVVLRQLLKTDWARVLKRRESTSPRVDATLGYCFGAALEQ